MKFRVVFSPEVEEQLADLYRQIALVASPVIAERYVNAIITYCETLETYPLRGTQRDDLRQGLRITNYKGRTLIAFAVDAKQVSIIGLFYGGQDYETALQIDIEDED